jgi:hypothetical protein
MIPLRVVAICSNVLFASFGALAHVYPVLVLHLILLPVNAARLLEILRLVRSVNAAELVGISIQDLLPFMSRRRLKAGDILLHKGDKADRMYYLASGRMQISELGKDIEAGVILGEIGIFSHDQKRTATVVCVEDCDIFEMSDSKAKQLYFQNRVFGLALLKLIIGRLTEGGRRPEAAANAL